MLLLRYLYYIICFMENFITKKEFIKLINEEKFRFDDLDNNDKEKVYDLFSDSYMKSTGNSWSKDKFFSRASDWLFFGEKNKGFITVRRQRSGLNKLTGVAGDLKGVKLGIDELISTGEPIWGMADKKIVNVLEKKFNFIVPPAEIIKIMLPMIPKGVFGGADYTINDDGSVTFHYNDVGDANKFFFGNEPYFSSLKMMLLMNPSYSRLSNKEKTIINNYFNTI